MLPPNRANGVAVFKGSPIRYNNHAFYMSVNCGHREKQAARAPVIVSTAQLDILREPEKEQHLALVQIKYTPKKNVNMTKPNIST